MITDNIDKTLAVANRRGEEVGWVLVILKIAFVFCDTSFFILLNFFTWPAECQILGCLLLITPPPCIDFFA